MATLTKSKKQIKLVKPQFSRTYEHVRDNRYRAYYQDEDIPNEYYGQDGEWHVTPELTARWNIQDDLDYDLAF